MRIRDRGFGRPGRQKWIVRWRGLDLKTCSRVSYGERSTTEVEFKQEDDGQLTMKGSMIRNSTPSIFEGRKIGPGPTITRETRPLLRFGNHTNLNL
jgi:hypothetical protein